MLAVAISQTMITRQKLKSVLHDLTYFVTTLNCVATCTQTMIHALIVAQFYLSDENEIVIFFLERHTTNDADDTANDSAAIL